jgi:hypothetical protein
MRQRNKHIITVDIAPMHTVVLTTGNESVGVRCVDDAAAAAAVVAAGGAFVSTAAAPVLFDDDEDDDVVTAAAAVSSSTFTFFAKCSARRALLHDIPVHKSIAFMIVG